MPPQVRVCRLRVRILHIIPSVSTKRGGPSLAVLAMVRALRACRVDAEIATTTDDGDGVLDVPVNQLTDREGVPVRFFTRFSPPLRPLREFFEFLSGAGNP